MIAWDTETTGVGASDHIVSLAAVRYSSRGRETGSFYRVIRPDGYAHMPEGAYNVHKISYEQACAEGVPFESAFRDFQAFCGPDAHLLAYNSQFDERMMRGEIARRGLDMAWFLDHTFSCAFELYKYLHCTKRGKLERVFTETFGRTFDAHNSLADARAAGELYFHLIDERARGRVVRPVREEMPCVTLKASDCATAIGRGFEDPQEPLKNLWAKYRPETFTQVTFEQRVRDLSSSQARVKTVLGDVKKFHTKSPDALREKIHSVTTAVEWMRALPQEDKKILKRYATGELHKKFSRTDVSRVDVDTRELTVCHIAGTEYRVCGRPGEIRDGVLFVVKNRTSRFMGVRDYEEVQCRVYLELCAHEGDITTCCLVERFRGETRMHTVERDLEKWEDIKLRLHNFFEYFHSVVV